MRDANDAAARLSQALRHKAAGNTNEALALLRDLTLGEPPYLPAYHELGLLFAGLDRTQEAKEILRRGIDLAAQAGNTGELNAMREDLEELEDEW